MYTPITHQLISSSAHQFIISSAYELTDTAPACHSRTCLSSTYLPIIRAPACHLRTRLSVIRPAWIFVVGCVKPVCKAMDGIKYHLQGGPQDGASFLLEDELTEISIPSACGEYHKYKVVVISGVYYGKYCGLHMLDDFLS